MPAPAGQQRRGVTATAALEPDLTLSRGDRYQPVVLLAAVGVGLVVGKLWPSISSHLDRVVTGGVLVLVFLVMLNITVGDLTAAVAERRFLGIAIGLNFVVNPLVAWGISRVLLSDPNLQVGLILFLVTPCIGWYLIFTELARGDAALGVSLLGVNVVLQVALLPLYLGLFAGRAAGVDLADILRSVVMFLVVPAGAASLVRALFAQAGIDHERIQRGIGEAHLKTIALIAVVVAMFGSEAETLFDNSGVVLTLLPALVVFFALTFVIAGVIGRSAGLPYAQTVLLVFTTTSRNSEASLAIAVTAFASPLVGLTVIVGPIVELPLLIVMVRLLRAEVVRSFCTRR